MKRIGIMYGMSEYTVDYYEEQIRRRLPQEVGRQIVVLGCPQVWQLEELVREERWEEVVRIMVREAQALRRAGAEFVVIPSFTLHMAADAIEASGVPVVRMDDCIVAAVAQMKACRLALLNAEVASREYLLGFYGRLEEMGCKLAYRSLMTVHTMIEFDHLTLSNQPRTREAWKECYWWYIEAVQLMAARSEVILNASVEMARILELRTLNLPAKVPMVNAVQLHVDAVVRACLADFSERDGPRG